MKPMPTPMTRAPAQPAAPAAPAAVGRPQPAPDSRITAEEYAAWLLPPEPRDATEKVVHALSLGAGALALMAGIGGVWWLL